MWVSLIKSLIGCVNNSQKQTSLQILVLTCLDSFLLYCWRYEIMNENYFRARHKNRRKNNKHFVTSNQNSTHWKLKLPLTSSISLVYLTLELQRKLEQTKVFLIYLKKKRKTHKIFKCSSCKTPFIHCVLLVNFASMNISYSMW